jgi:hypothetical protein
VDAAVIAKNSPGGGGAAQKNICNPFIFCVSVLSRGFVVPHGVRDHLVKCTLKLLLSIRSSSY